MPYLSVMTRIDGRKYDDMLITKGFRGFPSFAVLDAEGEIVVRHNGPRSVEGFQESVDRAQRYQDLVAKAATGDPVARIDLAILECELGRIDLVDCEARLKDLGELNAGQKKALGALRSKAAVEEQINKLRAANGGQEAFESAVDAFLKMIREGALPAGGMEANMVNRVLVSYAMQFKDVARIEKVVEHLKVALKDEPSARNLMDRMAGRLADLRAEAEEGAESDEEAEGDSEIEGS